MDRLEALRREIDDIDERLAKLYQDRMAAAARIAALKGEAGLPIRDPAREAEVLQKSAARISDPALRPWFAALQKELMAQSRAWQEARLTPGADLLLTVRAERGLCPVRMGRGLLNRAGSLLGPDRRVFLVTDTGVPPVYAEVLAAQCREARIHTIPAGEAGKSPAVLTELLSAMLDFGLTRGDCAAAVGGGVVGDLTGLAAALYMRGIDWYDFPTTLLAMIDASVGGKTAVNLGGVKNAAGAFWSPRAVFIDPEVLGTLPPRQLRNGLAEAVKMGLTHDPALFARFEDPAGCGPVEEIIAACLRVKASVVEADERELGPRRALNFGHTLGHGIEAAAGGALLHGECVALGMLPMCAPALRARLIFVLERLCLPTDINLQTIDPEAVLSAVTHDKKGRKTGQIEIVTVAEPGSFRLETASLQALRERLMSLFVSP